MSYAEANRMRRDMLELATAGFMRLVQGEVTDYGVTWSIAAKKLSQYQEFQTYIDIFGAESAQRLFRSEMFVINILLTGTVLSQASRQEIERLLSQ